MGSQLSVLAGCGIPGAAAVLIVLIKFSQCSKLDAIPTVGSSGWLGSWWASLRFLTNAQDVIQEGYVKHKSAPFKVSEPYHWLVIISSPEHVEELRNAPDDTVSLGEALNDRIHVEYTMGPEIHHNPYHIPIVRSQLTRNIGVLYPEIRNEVVTAFDDILNLKESEWKSVFALSTIQQVVCRTSNRLFVGLPLCRDPEWIDLNIRYTINIVIGSAIIGLIPSLFKPIVARFCTSIHQSNSRGRRLLGPIIEERQRYLSEYGDEWADKPNDFLSWLMDEAEGPESTVKYLTNRIMVINFVAIHTSSHSFTHALHFLAANPQYIQPLREEVESIVQKEGWSKASLGKMRKVDSFLKESQRLQDISGLSLMRKALKDFTLSGGTFIPKGTLLSAASRSIHHDEAFYENADAFEPFRFSDLREEDGGGLGGHHFASTTTEYLPFGHGRHACPGRFFAANELKSMLAHIVATYDVKMPDGAAHPKVLQFGPAILPDPSAKVMFRRRVN